MNAVTASGVALTFAQRQTLKFLRDFALLRCRWQTAKILRDLGFIEQNERGWTITKAGLTALETSFGQERQ